MQSSSRAPVLSATRSLVSTWITSPPRRSRRRASAWSWTAAASPRDGRCPRPWRCRPRHGRAGGSRAHHLLVLGMRLEDVDAHDHRPVHLVGHDDAAALLAPAPLFGCGLVLAHGACTFWAAARSWASVSSRAISRLARCSAAGFSSAPVACWNRRLNSSWRASPRRRSSSSSVSSRISLALKEITLPRYELCPDRELHGSQPDRLACQRLGHAGQLEHDTARLDHGYPVLGRALAGAHARLGRLGRDGLV